MLFVLVRVCAYKIDKEIDEKVLRMNEAKEEDDDNEENESNDNGR